MAVNFAFGTVEGLVIGMAFATNPAFGIVAMLLVGAYEYEFDHRDKVKDALNSLD